MTINWIEYGHLWGDDEAECFVEDGLNQPGVLVKYKTKIHEVPRDREYNDEQIALIGDVSPEGGSCGCCSDIRPDTLIVAYAVIYEPTKDSK